LRINGALGANKVERYYIAPYQRGYKWDSSGPYDQVPQLLIDLYDAYLKKSKEYFLQYITVKRIELENNKGHYEFEVIDGQQRLTTLSLFFLRLSARGKGNNISKEGNIYLVYYSRFSSENSNIFDQVNDMLYKNKDSDKDLNVQDFYYMVRACRCIDSFLDLIEDNIQDFVNYISDNVKIILNKENPHVSSEEIFTNLNDNKVPLTNAYLIKGLLLTKAARTNNELGVARNFNEILDLRIVMGRSWDEISAWFGQENVSHFFFKNTLNGMEEMLKLVDLNNSDQSDANDFINRFKGSFFKNALSQSNSSNFELFNHFSEVISTADDAKRILDDIKHIYRKLKSIYEDNKIYNLVGYALFAKKSKFSIKDILDLSMHDLEIKLKKYIVTLLPDKDYLLRQLNYSSDNFMLTNILLAYSVFPESKSQRYRFDFLSYDIQKWSFEHISPQHPNGVIKIDPSAIKWACNWIQANSSMSDDKKKELIEKVNKFEDIHIEDIKLMVPTINEIDSIGNMALLSGGVNSALSNNPFVVKRKILMDKINQGYFVPKHTLDVFSKILYCDKESFNPDFIIWDDTDVNAHMEWMVSRYNCIKENLLK
jgi:chaperonin cofactor prefoldin